jgi:hypothetical protein
MKDLQNELVKVIHFFSPLEGFNSSPVPGVYCIKICHSTNEYLKELWHASLALLVQGRKEIVLDREHYLIDETHYVATPINLPVLTKITSASHQKPLQ